MSTQTHVTDLEKHLDQRIEAARGVEKQRQANAEIKKSFLVGFQSKSKNFADRHIFDNRPKHIKRQEQETVTGIVFGMLLIIMIVASVSQYARHLAGI